MYEVGKLWASSQISVATEHLATAVTEGLLNQLSLDIASRDRVGKTVVVAGIQPELHQVGGKIVADTFEMHGWDSLYVGANTPPGDLLRMVGETKPHLVALSLAIDYNMSGLRAAIEAIRRESATPPVIVGGRGFQPDGGEITGQYLGVSYVPSLDALDVYLRRV
jgi:methanogenic corrinoid protein MtbC1